MKEFERDYADILATIKKHNIPLISFTLPANYSDYPPKSYYAPDYIIPSLKIDQMNYSDALVHISDPSDDGMLWFLKGKAMMGMGLLRDAKNAFQTSLQLLPVNRTTDETNDIILRTAKDLGFPTIRIDNLFEDMAENNMTGDNLMRDNCHWYNSLNELIILKILHTYRETFSKTYPADSQGLLIPDYYEFISKIPLERSSDESNLYLALFYAIDYLYTGDNNFKGFSVYLFKTLITYNSDALISLLHKDWRDFEFLLGVPFFTDEHLNLMKINWDLILLLAGEAFRMERRFEEARLFYDAANNINPHNPLTNFYKSLFYITLHEYVKASKFIDRIELSDDLIPAETIKNYLSEKLGE